MKRKVTIKIEALKGDHTENYDYGMDMPLMKMLAGALSLRLRTDLKSAAVAVSVLSLLSSPAGVFAADVNDASSQSSNAGTPLRQPLGINHAADDMARSPASTSTSTNALTPSVSPQSADPDRGEVYPRYPGAPESMANPPGSVSVGSVIGKSKTFDPLTGKETVLSDPRSSINRPDSAGDVQLRPAQLPSQSTIPTRTAASDANLNASSENARSAIDGDFSKHKNATILNQKSLNKPAPSGASGEKTPAVLTNPTLGMTGPGKASSSTVSLDEIQLSRPTLQSLVSVNNYLNPFQLDASSTGTINLRQSLIVGLDQNLDLAISRTNTKQRQFAYYSSLGNFLPDPTFGFSEYFTTGRVGLPFSAASVFGGATGTSTSSIANSSSSASSIANSSNTTIRVHRPIEIMHAGMDFYAYRGGSVLFGALQSKHNYKAAKHGEKASLSDTLMSISQNYYNLVLAETLLQIRIQAVRTSEEQLRRNLDRFHSGLATNLDVLQSRTQLSRDRQALVDQQINRRSSSITLATSLNCDLGADLMPVELVVKKVRLVDPRLTVADILQLAIDNRPELKQYEELRLAAKRAIMVAAANLQPSVLLSGNAYGIGPPSNVQALGVFAVNANWRLRGFGTVDAMDIQQARWQARQASLQSQKELQTILTQVRNSFLQILDKEKNIEEASSEVDSALEELRLAELRKSSGLGTNLDIITAQRDYTQALVDKAQTIVNFNIAQAQLVHDTGLISVDALTSNRLLSKSTR